MSRYNKGFARAGARYGMLGLFIAIAAVIIMVKVAIIWVCVSAAVSIFKNHQGCDNSYAIDSFVASNLFCNSKPENTK